MLNLRLVILLLVCLNNGNVAMPFISNKYMLSDVQLKVYIWHNYNIFMTCYDYYCSLQSAVLQLCLQDSQRWGTRAAPWRRLLQRLCQSNWHRDQMHSAFWLLCFYEGRNYQVRLPLKVWWLLRDDVQSQWDLRHHHHWDDCHTWLWLWYWRDWGQTSLLQWTPQLLLQHLNNHQHRGLLLLQQQVWSWGRTILHLQKF